MLRIIVISLFVANLLLLAFQQSKPNDQPEAVIEQSPAVNASLPTIHLVGELMQDWDLMSDNRKCFSLGPFYSSDERDEIRDELLEVSAYIYERQTQAQVDKGHWVFLRPYESLLESNRALLSLKMMGLKDIEIIYKGEWKNSISLGYFLHLKNALRRKKDLEKRGYTPSLRVHRQTEPRYWLDYEQNLGSSLITLDLQNRPNDFLQRSMPCPESGPVDSMDVLETGDGVKTDKG